MEEVLAAKAVSWRHDLATMLASASSDADTQALKAFNNALMPYLDNPESLRTLLGKIQLAEPIRNLSPQRAFESMEELKSVLPDTVNVIAA